MDLHRDYDSFQSLPEAFFSLARQIPEAEVYNQAIADENSHSLTLRKRRRVTFKEARRRVQAIARFLKENGLKKGEAVAIISQARPEWMEADLGVLSAGGIVVSVYPSLTAVEMGYILYDSNTKVVFAENQEQLDKILFLASNPCAIPGTEERSATTVRLDFKKIITFEQTSSTAKVTTLQEIYSEAREDSSDEFEPASRQDIACLVYTSGTTGPPKGVIQTHGNHLANVRQARDTKLFSDSAKLSLFLPLAHAFAKLIGYIGFLTPAGLEFPAITSTTSSKPNQDSVTRDIREGSSDIVPAVPRIFEKMQEGVLKKASAPGLSSKVLALTIWAAREYYQAAKVGRAPSLLVQMIYGATGAIRAKVKARLFGSNFKFAVSGGAKLQIATNEFFQALEIEVLEGYGLTETVVATNINRPWAKKIGSVGPVLSPDIEIKIAPDDEILMRGPNVASGYFNRQQATAQAWDNEGWFHSGDLGSIDSDGFLFITGRKKELIVTAGGKKISPDPIETKLKLHPFVSQVMLYGDEKPYCVALFTINADAVRAWAINSGKKISEPYWQDDIVRKELWQHVEKVNKALASFETVKRIRILNDEFTADNGMLTPTLKVKRREVVKNYQQVIGEMYSGDKEY